MAAGLARGLGSILPARGSLRSGGSLAVVISVRRRTRPCTSLTTARGIECPAAPKKSRPFPRSRASPHLVAMAGTSNQGTAFEADGNKLLTAAELDELKQLPIGDVTEPLPADRLEVRRGIAAKVWENSLKSDLVLKKPPEVQVALKARPPWQFYVCHDDRGTPDHLTHARRIYGVMEMGPNRLRYHAVRAMLITASDTLDGIPLDSDLDVVDNWPENEAFMIASLEENARAIFYDPLGTVLITG